MYKIKALITGLLLSIYGFSQQPGPGITVKAQVLYYDGIKVEKQQDLLFRNGHASIPINNAEWGCDRTGGGASGSETVFAFHLERGQADKAGVAVNFSFDDWSADNYVIVPSAVYNGNRFDVLKYGYPPLFKSKDYNKDLPITITDVPRLNKYNGESRLDLNTGDMSTPAVGIYFHKTGKGIWIIAEQATELGNSGFIFRENESRNKAEFTIAAPCVREKYYSMTNLSPGHETGVDLRQGDKVTIRYKLFTYSNLSSPKDLNDKFPAIRKSYGASAYVNRLPFSKAFELMERQEGEWWSEKDSMYTLGGDSWNLKWQLGWVGGLMVTLPMSEAGGDSSVGRAFRNYQRIITESQAGSGFYYGCGNGKAWCSDCFWNPHPDNLLLLRKNADALYFIYKYCFSQKTRDPQWQMPAAWKEPLNKLSEAFVRLWNENHQFGQFVDINTGEIKVGGSNSAVAAISGLALASKYENKPQWLRVAKEAARYYYNHFTVKGVSCGGPGEILQNNDAESAFATLESFVTLYEVTREKEWLKYAEDAAAFCSTWMVSYDYRFPENTLFGGLDMKTTGAVWASTQNKHGGPGICTASGDCLFKLYRATGNKLYLNMARDVAHNIMQYISRADRPIKDQRVGWINERVNLSDWEGKDNIGNVFHGNTWAQVSAMLTVAQIPGIYINTFKKELVVFDHVEAALKGDSIVIKNPTAFDANIRVFIDKDPSSVYPQGFISTCPTVFVPSGGTKTVALAHQRTVSDYDIRWTTPGEDSQGSMPIGNGDIGANVWVEGNGDLLFYVSKTDAWSETGRLLKLGRVRVSITPNPFREGIFVQELKLKDGAIWIDYGDTRVRCQVDANNPVVQTEVVSKRPVNVKVVYETWRRGRHQITGDEGGSAWGIGERQVSKDCPGDIFQEADSIVAGNENRIMAFHRNPYSIWKENLSVQALDKYAETHPDPLLNRTFGMMVTSAGMINQSDSVLASGKASTHFRINVYPLTKIGGVAEWKKAVMAQERSIESVALQKREMEHQQWWKDFWGRSYIFISAKDPSDNKEAETVTRSYILQRYINACSGRGPSPIKFNGSIFTVDTYHRDGQYANLDADFRLWGGCYWWQNTRLPYWSMLLSGDLECMQPLFKMYMDALPLRVVATRKYYGHDGAFFPETMNFWGTYADGDYGCKRDGLPDGFAKNPYIRYYWQSGLELSLMMADYYAFTGSYRFAKDTLLPFAAQILTFYDQHWKRGADGRILFDPAMSLETFHTAVNPLPEIVGIRKVAERMLQLPKQIVSKEQSEQWGRLIRDLPEIPKRSAGTDTLLAPAQQYSNKANMENPELYAVFPYRVYGVGKPGLDMAIRTYRARAHKENGGWQQNSIQAACLGLGEDAKKMVVESFSSWDRHFRFPAFWGPNYDWTPDQDHGCVAMNALQRMLLQYDAGEVRLMPAWPKEWNVQFKLRGPDRRVYEGVYENGKMVKLSKTGLIK